MRPPTNRRLAVATRSYQDALAVLHSRRRGGRPSKQANMVPDDPSQPEVMPGAGRRPDLRGIPSIAGMADWLQNLGHSTADIDALNVIHVAGTKGKGSTCAWAESFLRAHGRRTGFPAKTGLYTSPHLKYPEERIRINFQPLARDLFTKYFFEVYNGLQQEALPGKLGGAPHYLQLWCLVAMHAFIKEAVDTAIFETHSGGEFDATNVISHPVSTVVTTLGMDHVKQLGPTIENIAWHKSGIFKQGAAAFSAPQDEGPGQVLRDRAIEKNALLRFVVQDAYPLLSDSPKLQPQVQRINSQVAIAAVNALLNRRSTAGVADKLSPDDIMEGIDQFHWPGRFQLIIDGNIRWYLDGAHNELSVNKAVEWFVQSTQASKTSGAVTRFLIFSQDSIQRDGEEVLACLSQRMQEQGLCFHHVIFTTYALRESSTSTDLGIDIDNFLTSLSLDRYPELWRRIEPCSKVQVIPYISQAITGARDLARSTAGGELHALVTGSQHLVGGVLRGLEAEPD